MSAAAFPLRGVVPPLVTPFHPDGRLDLEAFEANLERYAGEDLGGYLVLGSNGEAASLEEEASEIPVLLYSVPVYTGFTFPPPLVAMLAAHPGIRGIKESSGDVGLLARIASATPSTFVVACGSGPVFYPALCVGAPAGVLAIACCMPRATAAIYRAFEKGDHVRARRLQEALSPLAVAVTATHAVAGLKAAMTLAGLGGGEVRAPLVAVAGAVREELGALLRSASGRCADILAD
jgi:dihydrodipicolinate synthase/N-acetylneuraminate lyase